MGTQKGTIVMRLEADLSPIAAGNFVALAGCGFYDGGVFHRTAALEDGTPFVIQGGDPTGTGSGGPGYTIQDEAVTAPYGRGVVAMARSSEPNSVGSQFFIVLDDKAAETLARLQHLSDHRPRHVRDGRRRCDLRRLGRRGAAREPRQDDHGHRRHPVSPYEPRRTSA